MNWEKIRTNVHTIGKLGRLSKTYRERIDKNTESVNDCWIWRGTKQYTGKGHQHGCIWYNKKYVQVHRLMYHNFVEDVPEYERTPGSLQVNHKCKTNGTCINPLHLYLGTAKQNTKDSIEDETKNKAKKGEDNHNAILLDELVEYIKSLKGSGISQYEIANKYGVNQSQISRWWNNKTRTSDE